MKLVIRGGTLVTMDSERRVVRGDLIIQGGHIVEVGDAAIVDRATEILDATDCIVLPGLVQAHTHLCQTLCRGRADDLPLLEWLRERIWPHESALDEKSMRASARLAAAELLLGGTTAILDMGSVHETDALIDAIGHTGLRAVVGKAMMDMGDGVPRRLREETARSLDESDELAARYTGAFDGRIRYAYAPRFVLSCTEGLLSEVAARVKQGLRAHTHASEQAAEIEIVRRERGSDNIAYFSKLGLDGPGVTLAHCVHATNDEQALLASRGTHVTHCPSSNLKLGSGIAPIAEMLERGINVALGFDGAPCNNTMDGFAEMRLAALLQKGLKGPTVLPATQALELATLSGARALGLEREIGSLEVGKRADVIIVDPRKVHSTPNFDCASTLVYSIQRHDVRDVLVDGRVLVRNGALTELTGLVVEEVISVAETEARRIVGW